MPRPAPANSANGAGWGGTQARRGGANSLSVRLKTHAAATGPARSPGAVFCFRGSPLPVIQYLTAFSMHGIQLNHFQIAQAFHFCYLLDRIVDFGVSVK
jgi:hypothetical protein